MDLDGGVEGYRCEKGGWLKHFGLACGPDEQWGVGSDENRERCTSLETG